METPNDTETTAGGCNVRSSDLLGGLVRPECWDFAMEFLGSPEDAEVVAYVERLEGSLAELARYFTSGNSVPVERATIKANDFWRITGMTPNE
ncbi:MAG: hypothetical protein RJQ08_13555 [Salinisphaeraceae bacterium]